MSTLSPRVGGSTKLLFVVSTFLFWVSLYVYVPILSVYTQTLGGSLAMVGLVVGAYGITQVALRVPLGIVSDRLGRRKPFILAGALTAALGALGFALSSDPWMLFLSRALTGVAASSWVAFTVLFSSYFPPRQAVRAMSLATLVSGSSQLVATFAGGQIAEQYGYLATFYVGVALALVAFVISLRVAEEVRPSANPPSWSQVLRIVTVPLLLLVSLNAVLSQYAAYVTTYAFTPIYAERLGASRADQGLLVTAMLIFWTLGQPLAGPLVERLGERLVVALGMLLAAGAIAATPSVTSLPWLLALQAICGFGRGVGFPVLMGLSLRSLPQEQRATAMGVFQAVYALGMFAGPFAGGQIADSLGLNAVFYSTGLVCVLSAALSFTLPGRRGTSHR